MRVIILGSGAGGGFPQWNCRCAVCALFWAGDGRVRRRTQSSIAVSADGARWTVLNCSPDIREQIGKVRALQPNGTPRGSPIAAVLVTNGDADHIGGLLSLREQTRFELIGTEAVLGALAASPVFNVLDPAFVTRSRLEIGVRRALPGGLMAEAFHAPGKVPLYMEDGTPETDVRSAFTIGLEVWDAAAPERRLVYIPGCGRIDDALKAQIEGAALLLFDGTVWHNDEMALAGVGSKTGLRMGHVPVAGEAGSMAALADVQTGRCLYIHLNNTNPLLVDGSAERLEAKAKGWDVSCDGLEIEL